MKTFTCAQRSALAHMSGVGQPQSKPSSGGSTLIAQCWQVWARSDSHRVSGPQLTPLARSGQGGLQTTVNIAKCLHGAQASHITEPGERNLLRSDEKVLVGSSPSCLPLPLFCSVRVVSLKSWSHFLCCSLVMPGVL